MTVNLPIRGACHCGSVSYELKVRPRFAISCNCSICRRLGAVWGHGDVGEAEITCEPGATLGYSHGDRELVFHTCKTCGSTTHWEAVAGPKKGRVTVNLNLAELGTVEAVGLRHFDGAETWTFLD
ncbi:GFA family protein [Roseibium sp. Sym1]|uniref:GFA family protein n=1 Tax=Roseibium sp. Sym1 TaxID=3016006 RepID=UPI0022B38529|nr:GFA family protein [Roseibium sp. Sym1]